VRPALEPAAARRDVPQLGHVPASEFVDEAVERIPIGAEPDDHEPGRGHPFDDERPGREQQVDALGDDQLADEADDPVASRIELAQCLGRARLAAPGGGLAGGQLGGEPLEPGPRVRGRPEAVHVDARRAQPGALRQRGVFDEDLPKGLGGVPRADEHGGGAANALERVG
jgi:hypothetical protein